MSDSDDELLEKPVKKVEVLQRAIHSGDRKDINSSSFNHQAVRVTTHQEKQYIIETGPSSGRDTDVSITKASRSNEEWKKTREAVPSPGKTMRDFYESADPNRKWNLITNNCQDAVKRMLEDNVQD